MYVAKYTHNTARPHFIKIHQPTDKVLDTIMQLYYQSIVSNIVLIGILARWVCKLHMHELHTIVTICICLMLKHFTIITNLWLFCHQGRQTYYKHQKYIPCYLHQNLFENHFPMEKHNSYSCSSYKMNSIHYSVQSLHAHMYIHAPGVHPNLK